MLCLCTFTYFKLHTSFKLLWCQLNWSQIKFAKLRLAVFLKLGECKIVQTRVRTSCLISRNSISFLFIINVISNTIYLLLKNITHRSSYVPTAPENIRLRSVYFLIKITPAFVRRMRIWCTSTDRPTDQNLTALACRGETDKMVDLSGTWTSWVKCFKAGPSNVSTPFF